MLKIIEQLIDNIPEGDDFGHQMTNGTIGRREVKLPACWNQPVESWVSTASPTGKRTP